MDPILLATLLQTGASLVGDIPALSAAVEGDLAALSNKTLTADQLQAKWTVMRTAWETATAAWEAAQGPAAAPVATGDSAA